MQLKKLDYLTNLLFDNYTLLHIVNNIKVYPFFVVINTCNMSNNDLLDLKNNLFQLSAKSMVIKAKYIRTLFLNYFSFLKSSCLCIYITDKIQFLNIVKLLKNSLFFYSYNKSLSNVINSESLIIQDQIYSSYINLHYIIFKLINNIILIILYYITLFNKLLRKV